MEHLAILPNGKNCMSEDRSRFAFSNGYLCEYVGTKKILKCKGEILFNGVKDIVFKVICSRSNRSQFNRMINSGYLLDVISGVFSISSCGYNNFEYTFECVRNDNDMGTISGNEIHISGTVLGIRYNDTKDKNCFAGPVSASIFYIEPFTFAQIMIINSKHSNNREDNGLYIIGEKWHSITYRSATNSLVIINPVGIGSSYYESEAASVGSVNIAFGQLIKPRCNIQFRENNLVCYYIMPVPDYDKSYMFSVHQQNKIVYGRWDAMETIAYTISYSLSNMDFNIGFPAIAKAQHEVILSHNISPYITALVLAVCIEGLCSFIVLDQKSDIIRESFVVEYILKRFSPKISILNRILGAAKSVRKTNASERLRSLVDKGLISKEMYKSWTDRRNSLAHGKLLNGQIDDKIRRDVLNLIEMYKMIIIHIVYYGRIERESYSNRITII